MALNFIPADVPELKPKITVIGVGGAGGNAVNNMIQSHLEGVDFVVANTDAQALAQSRTDRRIQLGTQTTQGLGAGSRPDIGRIAAEETYEEILSQIDGSNMVFITAGMGGGTGTGAAPVIARVAKEKGILTVGVVTKPFHFEGAHRMRTAEAGISELQNYVDTLIIIPNQNLFRVATERTTFADAFKMADDVLHSGVRGVTDLMMMPGLINLDFADIRTVMSEMGKAMMGTGEAEGEKRSTRAAEAAISNPLLDDTSMKGARGVLINITGGPDMTLFEVDEAANRIRDEVDPDANIIFGSTFDDKLTGKMRVSVVATGIEAELQAQPRPTIVQLSGGKRDLPQPAPVVAPAFRGAAAPAMALPEIEPVSPQPTPAIEPIVARAVSQPSEIRRAEPRVVTQRPDPHNEQRRLDLAHEPRHERQEPRIHPRMEPSFDPSVHNPPPPADARRPTLFDRISAVRNRQTAQPQRPTAPAPQAQTERNAHERPSPAQPMAHAQPAQPSSPPRVNPAGSNLTNVRSSDVDLDIPAFLRRQAN
jgi:cell division protein FtsZ